MTPKHAIDSSKRAYARLLTLYPQAHRQAYGQSMLQVFGDQCREAHTGRGRLGLLALWLRTLFDLAISVLREHLTDPNAASGLIDAPRGKPLPWKGAILVLLPGLVFFVAQIAQMNGETWYMYVVRRAAYFLILPVLVAWVWKRRFPVWGLMPLGLLIQTGCKYISMFGMWFYLPNVPFAFLRRIIVALHLHENFALKSQITTLAIVAILLALTLWRLWGVACRRPGRRAWVWLAVFGAFLVYQVLSTYTWLIDWYGNWPAAIADNSPGDILVWFLWPLQTPLMTLLVVLWSAAFTRRFGTLALLLPAGYFLPTVLYGYYSSDFAPEQLFYWIIPAVLLYRALLAVAAPLLVARSATHPRQARAFAVTAGLAAGVQAALNIVWLSLSSGGWNPGIWDYLRACSNSLNMALAVALAVALCLPQPAPGAAAPEPAPALAGD